MKLTNLILAIFLIATVTVTEAQNPLSESMLASTSSASFSDVSTSEKPTKEDLSLKETAPIDFVFFCYPSMFTNELHVTTDFIEASEIQLVNEAGSIVFKQKVDGIVENEKLTIPTVLPAGTYFLKIKDQEAATIKLIKKD